MSTAPIDPTSQFPPASVVPQVAPQRVRHEAKIPNVINKINTRDRVNPEAVARIPALHLHDDEQRVRTLKRKIHKLSPWHMNIQVTDDLNTGQVFSKQGRIYHRPSNKGVSLLNLRDSFLRQIDAIYPDGLAEKTFLDCACNAGGYCFWTRERNVKKAFGFDVRPHWIEQARFLQQNRCVAPTNRIHFQVNDLYDLPKRNLHQFDITMFKGIFYHLPDPVTGLKIAADLTREVMFFNTSTTWGEKDGYMKAGWESRENVMSGVHGLKWYPTGPRVTVEMLKWMGFVEMKIVFFRRQRDRPELGRTEIVASKVKGLLERIPGRYVK